MYGIRNTQTGTLSLVGYPTLELAEKVIERTAHADELEAVELTEAEAAGRMPELLVGPTVGDADAGAIAGGVELDAMDNAREAVESEPERERARRAQSDAEYAAAVKLHAETSRYCSELGAGASLSARELVRHLIARNENGYSTPLEPFELRPILAAIAGTFDAIAGGLDNLETIIDAMRPATPAAAPAMRDENCLACLEGTGRHTIDCRATAGARDRDDAEHGPIVTGEPVELEPVQMTLGELYAAHRYNRITTYAYTLELNRRGVTVDAVNELMGLGSSC